MPDEPPLRRAFYPRSDHFTQGGTCLDPRRSPFRSQSCVHTKNEISLCAPKSLLIRRNGNPEEGAHRDRRYPFGKLYKIESVLIDIPNDNLERGYSIGRPLGAAHPFQRHNERSAKGLMEWGIDSLYTQEFFGDSLSYLPKVAAEGARIF